MQGILSMNRIFHMLTHRISRFFIAAFIILVGASTLSAQRSSNIYGPRSGTWRAGIQGGAIGFGCDYTKNNGNYRYLPYFYLDGAYFTGSWISIFVFAGTGKMSAQFENIEASSSFVKTGIGGEFRYPVARGSFAPFVTVRIGALFYQPRTTYETYYVSGENGVTFLYGGGFGVEYIYQKKIGLRFELGSALTLSDKLDNTISGPRNDGYTHFSFGISYYFTANQRRR
jgi:hypothetical protein